MNKWTILATIKDEETQGQEGQEGRVRSLNQDVDEAALKVRLAWSPCLFCAHSAQMLPSLVQRRGERHRGR